MTIDSQVRPLLAKIPPCRELSEGEMNLGRTRCQIVENDIPLEVSHSLNPS